MKSLNPANERVIWEEKEADEEDINAAIICARKAFCSWSKFSLEQRKGICIRFAERLFDQEAEFAVLISVETGKPLWESTLEVKAMQNKIKISIQAYDERCGIKGKDLGLAMSYTRFKPHGVVAVLGPFNLPGHLPNGHIVPALLAGNTVVFKPSEHSPSVGEKYVQIWKDIGLPEGVLNLVQGTSKTGRFLAGHRDLNGLFFTGSYATGSSIHKLFGGCPEKILALEMGGNNPLIVDHIRDVKASVYTTIQSAFITSGQRCVCARRLIVCNGKEGDRFIKQLLLAVQKIKVGAYDECLEPFMGPVISGTAANKVLRTQECLLQQGGVALIKMERLGDCRAMLSPGVIDVTYLKTKKDSEIFGPLLQVIRVDDLDEAIKEANRTEYGLAAGILTDDLKIYEKFWNQSRAGIVNWNRALTGASSLAPFGGVGKSGNHRPSAYFAADYCSYPVASMESHTLTLPEKLSPGVVV
ncbi:Succinylglutamic semialdehyde dehydrogenase [hydrothermal vent metagenome]|uniref:Succinylglutamic semialdehyde dehydrogenase n=1 Tax=hydrothermal vent metagenome TaxID=652676 RepID=A0A3B1DGK7_9ZZZZ